MVLYMYYLRNDQIRVRSISIVSFIFFWWKYSKSASCFGFISAVLFIIVTSPRIGALELIAPVDRSFLPVDQPTRPPSLPHSSSGGAAPCWPLFYSFYEPSTIGLHTWDHVQAFCSWLILPNVTSCRFFTLLPVTGFCSFYTCCIPLCIYAMFPLPFIC